MKRILSSIIITCMLLMMFCNVSFAGTAIQSVIAVESGASGISGVTGGAGGGSASGSVVTPSIYTSIITAENGVVGDTINVTVSIPANTNAAGGSFNLVYDNTKMELVDATAGDIISAFFKDSK